MSFLTKLWKKTSSKLSLTTPTSESSSDVARTRPLTKSLDPPMFKPPSAVPSVDSSSHSGNPGSLSLASMNDKSGTPMDIESNKQDFTGSSNVTHLDGNQEDTSSHPYADFFNMYFFNLPLELQIETFSYLWDSQLCLISLTSKQFYMLTSSEILWCERYKRRFARTEITTGDDGSSSWKQKYIKQDRLSVMYWDPNMTTDYLVLSDSNLTVTNKHREGGYALTMGSRPITDDVFYWEHQIMNFGHQYHPGNDDQLFFGVAEKPQNKKQLCGDVRCRKNVWCCLTTCKTSHGQPYGQKFNLFDRIGIKVDTNEGTVTFYKNDECMGVAFTNVPTKTSPLYPVLGITYGGGCVTTNFKAVCPDLKQGKPS